VAVCELCEKTYAKLRTQQSFCSTRCAKLVLANRTFADKANRKRSLAPESVLKKVDSLVYKEYGAFKELLDELQQ
jgi:hypothetical protein